MKNHLLFWGVLAIFVKPILVTAQDEDERTVLVDNKCTPVHITSRIIPSVEETKFVYHLSNLCKKCDPTEVDLDNQVVTVTQRNICDKDNETCYLCDRNKCYTNECYESALLNGGKTIMVETALTPDSCYPD
uniref:Joining chain of multimeric IgA and IgM n=1 Tax=Rhinolophus ferrumequinum TaxID=59479 RepID=A0A671EHP9_RHIFE